MGEESLFPRMMGEDGGLPGGGVDVGVDLGGEDGFVAEHFLDDAEVGAVFDEVGREGVAEGVGGDFLVDACDERLLLDEVEDGHPAERAAVFVEEGDVVEGGLGGRGASGQIGREGVRRHLAEGDEPFLVAFADYAHEAFLEVDVRDEQAAGLGDPQAAAVEDLEDGAVAEGAPVAGGDVHGVEDGADFLDGEDLRQVAPELGRVDAVAGIVLAFAFEHEPVEEGAQGAQEARLGALGEGRDGGAVCSPSGRARRDVAPDVVGADGAGFQFHRLQELCDVAPVGRHRVGRQLALHPQIVAVVLEDAGHFSSAARAALKQSRQRGS